MVVWGQGGSLVDLAGPDWPADTRTKRSVVTRRAGHNENLELLLSRWVASGHKSCRVYNGIHRTWDGRTVENTTR
jgi:hypothetical protein